MLFRHDLLLLYISTLVIYASALWYQHPTAVCYLGSNFNFTTVSRHISSISAMVNQNVLTRISLLQAKEHLGRAIPIGGLLPAPAQCPPESRSLIVTQLDSNCLPINTPITKHQPSHHEPLDNHHGDFRRPCRPRLGVRRQPARGDATPAGLRARTTGAAMPRRWWWPRWSRRSRTSPCRRGGSS